MGCGASKSPASRYQYSTVDTPETAEDVYMMAANPSAEQVVPKTTMIDRTRSRIALVGSRDPRNFVRLDRPAMLSALFDACDEDKSGYIDLLEFTRIFQLEEDLAINIFLLIDATDHPDGKISKEEFVKWHVERFSQLNERAFERGFDRLLQQAEEGGAKPGHHQRQPPERNLWTRLTNEIESSMTPRVDVAPSGGRRGSIGGGSNSLMTSYQTAGIMGGAFIQQEGQQRRRVSIDSS